MSVTTLPKRRAARSVVQGCIDSDTLVLDDQRLYQWTDREQPPRSFCVHKTIFRNMTPAEISSNGWHVLRPAIKELAVGCGLQTVAPKIDWLKLDTVYNNICCAGVYGDEIVTAGSTPQATRNPFIPFRFFERIEKNKDWKNKQYWSSYRHFNAKFDIGLSFYTDRHKLLCDVAYAVHCGIHRYNSLTATIRIGNIIIMSPYRVRISETFSDLPGKVDWIGRQSQEFIRRVGAHWIHECDSEGVYNAIKRIVNPLDFPKYLLLSLKQDCGLARCRTNLDMLLLIAKHFNLDVERYAVPLLNLSHKLLPRKKGKKYGSNDR
jgi:hypothetical protein